MWGFFLFCFLILPSIINHISWDIFFHSNMWYALLGRHFILNRKKYTAYKYLCCSRKSENKLALKKKKRVKCEEQGECTTLDYQTEKFLNTFRNEWWSIFLGCPGGYVVKNLLAHPGDARNTSLIPGLGRSSEVGSDKSLQYSCLGNPMDRGTWWAIFLGVAKESDRT